MKKSVKIYAVLPISFFSLLFVLGCGKSMVANLPVPVDQGGYIVPAEQYVVSTLVNHVPAPQGLTIDGQGNLYIASSANSSILKMTPAGLLSPLILDRSF